MRQSVARLFARMFIAFFVCEKYVCIFLCGFACNWVYLNLCECERAVPAVLHACEYIACAYVCDVLSKVSTRIPHQEKSCKLITIFLGKAGNSLCISVSLSNFVFGTQPGISLYKFFPWIIFEYHSSCWHRIKYAKLWIQSLLVYRAWMLFLVRKPDAYCKSKCMCYLQYKPFDINEDIIVQQQYFISFLVMINVVIYECGLNIWNAQLG